jgi:hypothetical protein
MAYGQVMIGITLVEDLAVVCMTVVSQDSAVREMRGPPYPVGFPRDKGDPAPSSSRASQ